jgi:RNA polymerase sigma factor (sigma-70 family)
VVFVFRRLGGGSPVAGNDQSMTPTVASVQSGRTDATAVGEAFTQFYRAERGAVMAMLWTAGATEQEAEDATQQAMLDVLNRWSTITFPRAYVRTAAWRFFVKIKEEVARRARTTDELGVLGAADDINEGSVWEDETWVRDHLRSLPPMQREVMESMLESLKPAQISRLVGRTEGAVRQSLRDARTKLKERLVSESRGENPSNPKGGGRG